MDVGRIVGAAALLGGGAALGAVGTYAAVRSAGASDGGAMSLVGMLGGNSLVMGGAAGIVAMQAARIGGGGWAPGVAKALAIPAGIAGAALGGRIARAGLEREHRTEYHASAALIDDVMVQTQEMFREAGADEATLARVRETYDRSYFNASYQPPLGPFRNQIVVGRHPETGAPLAINDVIAHEFTHKVLHAYAPKLIGRSGDGRAIHEHVADTFAMVVDRGDWLVGEDAVPGGMRSFSHPELHGAGSGEKLKPAPITREQLRSSTEEHLGAGVGNKAAWRIGMALGRDEMARLYVAALERRELGSGATYEDLAGSLRAAAVDLHGAGSVEARVVDESWTQAGY